jgi:hypothetical protein
MGSWKTVGLRSVRREVLVNSIANEGLSWVNGLHVTATQSLCDAFLSANDRAISVGNLIDMVSLQNVSHPFGVSLDSFPAFPIAMKEGLTAYRNEKQIWTAGASRAKTIHSFVFDQFLIRYLRQNSGNASMSILGKSRMSIRKTIQNLENAGITPNQINPDTDLSRAVQQIWLELEKHSEYRFVSLFRKDYWDYESNNSLASRVQAAITKLTNAQSFDGTVFLHGFYFFTPIQRAFFKALRDVGNFNLVFVIHDDGKSKSFETWRRYFSSTFDMPLPEYLEIPNVDISPNVAVLEDALEGRTVQSIPGCNIAITAFDDPTHFVKYLRQDSQKRKDQGIGKLRIYGAKEKDLQRFTQRLSGSLVNSSVALYQLPVGMFLVSLHNCLEIDEDNNIELKLTFEDFMNMSPYLIQTMKESHIDLETISKTAEFFSTCSVPEDWEQRAALLVLSIRQVHLLGNDGQGMNALRLLPWLDISTEDALEIEKYIKLICNLVREISLFDRVGADEYSKFLKKHLAQALKTANPELHEEVLGRMEMFNLGDDFQFEVGGLVELVQKLLGRESDYDEEESNGHEDFVSPLRALDALAFTESSNDVLLANLSDKSFPSSKSLPIWPFTLDEISGSSSRSSNGLEVLKLNSDASSLSDLYLFRVAIEGVGANNRITVSWLEEALGENLNASPAVSMLMKPDYAPESILEAIGGLEKVLIPSGHMDDVLTRPPSYVPQVIDKGSFSQLSDLEKSSALYCEKRFALQWAMAQSHSFRPEHMQKMLYGNMSGYLMHTFGIDKKSADLLRSKVWVHLPDGVKASSEAHKVIMEFSNGAAPVWIYNLGGSKSSSPKLTHQWGRQHAAYQVLLGQPILESPKLNEVGGTDPIPLGPVGVQKDISILCNMCPVSNICSTRGDLVENDDESD